MHITKDRDFAVFFTYNKRKTTFVQKRQRRILIDKKQSPNSKKGKSSLNMPISMVQ
jgi:hypothetical protein